MNSYNNYFYDETLDEDISNLIQTQNDILYDSQELIDKDDSCPRCTRGCNYCLMI
jgi:hypothetical protein